MDLDQHAGSPQEPEAVPTWAKETTDLADERLGGTILFATDEWFARAESLLDPSPATFDINAYCEFSRPPLARSRSCSLS